MREWISVKDKLPWTDDNVLVYTNVGEQFGAVCWIEGAGDDQEINRTWVDSFNRREIETDDHPRIEGKIIVTHWKWLDDVPKETTQ
tara:strand:+ start:163 stop:420 length:258 start_codon:yes stop_codon:yes gene_type:complete